MDYILTIALNCLFNVVLCDLKSGSQIFEFYRPMKRNKQQKPLGTMTNGLSLKFFFFFAK